MGGERGRARLEARITLPGEPVTLGYAETTGEATLETPSGSASSQFTASVEAVPRSSPATVLELSADLADLFAVGGSGR
jgi:hypothetical protein